MKIIETVGTLTKKETIASMDHHNESALVLETFDPYPGYHGANIPDSLNPKSVFLVTDTRYSGEAIIRATMAVKKNFRHDFDAVPGYITIFNTLTPCIRIKRLYNYTEIEELIRAYRANGIDFHKKKRIEPYSGLIKVRKYFILKQVEPNIYVDETEPGLSYFEIPGLLSWDIFENITLSLKPNVYFSNFDAAFGVFYNFKGVVDYVRIFCKEIAIEDIRYLRSKYLEEISRIM